MEVHHIINSYSLMSGGAEKLVRSMHVSMRDRGIASRIFGLQAHEDAQLASAESLGLKSPYSLKAILGIRNYVEKNVRAGDVVHAHLFPANLYVSLLKQLGSISVPVVTTEHSTFNSRRNTLIGRVIDPVLYRGFDRIFTISDGVKRALINWQPATARRVSTVQNGIRFLFSDVYHRSEKGMPVILSVGGLRRPKNYETMLRAMALLNEYEFEYWIAGDGSERSALEKLSVELGIRSKVRFLGHVADIKPLLEQADIFLMASRWEGFGLAVVEAMNASLAVVVSNVDGLSEIVNSELLCAKFVSPDSPASISQAVRELLCSKEQRNQLGRAGFQRSKYFSEDRMINRYIEEYEDVLNH